MIDYTPQKILNDSPPNPRDRFVDMSILKNGMQISRSWITYNIFRTFK